MFPEHSREAAQVNSVVMRVCTSLVQTQVKPNPHKHKVPPLAKEMLRIAASGKGIFGGVVVVVDFLRVGLLVSEPSSPSRRPPAEEYMHSTNWTLLERKKKKTTGKHRGHKVEWREKESRERSEYNPNRQ